MQPREIYRQFTMRDMPWDAAAASHLAHLLLKGGTPPREWLNTRTPFEKLVRDAIHAGEPDTTDRDAATRCIRIVLEAIWLATDTRHEDLAAYTRAAVDPMVDAGTHAGVEPISTILQRVVSQVETPVAPLATPFTTLNWHCDGGLRPGELVYLGGRPGIGKSALMIQMARHAAQAGHAVLVVSLEMSPEALGRRMIAHSGGLDASGLRTGHDVDHAHLAETVRWLYDLPIDVTTTTPAMLDIAAQLARKPYGLVIVDYLQLLTAPSSERDARTRVEWNSKALKRLCLTHHVPVIALSSLSRPIGGDEDKSPSLGSLRDSGALEHDADIVLLLHRKREARLAELLIVKNRDGKQGKVSLVWRPECVTFNELDEGDISDRP